MKSVRSCCLQRAKALSLARQFFSERNVLEVDPLLLSTAGSIDTNIDLFVTPSDLHGNRFLFSSPEYPMKRLLCEGVGDIYYLGHVFRHEDDAKNHSPEFLMAEWYRVGSTFSNMIDETVAFIELFIGNRKRSTLSYREAFLRFAHIDPFQSSDLELKKSCQSFEGYPIHTASRDELLNLILALKVEPSFPPNELTVLTHYPSSQAALAQKITIDTTSVAERFEIYCEGLELANGYHELANPEEQRSRFLKDNAERTLHSKPPYPIDENFLAALTKGLPDCCGVAVGVDRLLMIQHKVSSISDIMPISWSEA